MPEAHILYGVTAVVVAGLAGWVVAVLRTAKEPWQRAVPAPEPAAPLETEDADDAKKEPAKEQAKAGSADVTAEATAVDVPDADGEKKEEKTEDKKDEAT